MKRFNLFYFISEAFKGLKRNGVMTFASVAVLMSCLVVIGGFSMLVLNINLNLEELGLKNEIVAFCHYNDSEENIEAVEEQIKSLKNVDEVTRITKSEALASMKGQYDAVQDITEEENPLSDSFEISYLDNSDVPDLVYELNKLEGIRKVKNRTDIANMMENLKNTVMMVFGWFFAILFVVSIFIIVNTIKIAVFSRRTEISIMRYIGATKSFITMPFIIEGVVIGVFAGTIAYFIVKYAYLYVETLVMADLQMISFIQFSDTSLPLLLGFIGIGIATGIAGSFISLAKYLKS